MCTVAIVITWALAAAYQFKLALGQHDVLQAVIGAVAVIFLVVGVMFNGWSYLLLTCVGYVPGIFVYMAGRKENDERAFSPAEKVVMIFIVACAVLALVLLFTGFISF
jgi:arginine:ornithine antiporter/lysine permease